MAQSINPEALADRAIVIGAGIGGIFAAGAMRRFFREVVVLEKDELPSHPAFRKGVPQGPHGHIVLKRGENIAEELFPGFRERLEEAGGVKLDASRDMARYAFGEWGSPPDTGMTISCQSRALLEHVLRDSLLAISNVSIRSGSRFRAFCFEDGRVRGARVSDTAGRTHEIEAALVVDASGRGTGTPLWLKDAGFGDVATDRIGIGLGYVTGIFEAGDTVDEHPRLCTVSETPPDVRGGTTLPIEEQQWMVTLSGRGDDVPPLDLGGFLDFAKSLPDPRVYERIAGSRLVGSLRRFKTPESFWRHYERMPSFPEGLIPIGDSVAGFNPIFGQGMSVAAVEAEALGGALEDRVQSDRGLAGLHELMLPRISETISEAWEGPATIDYLYDTTKGERPPDYGQRRALLFAMQELAREDDDLQRAQYEVGNMLATRASILTPDVVSRLKERMTTPVGG